MTARRRLCGRTNFRRREASYARQRTTRLEIRVSINLANVIAALTVLMLMFFHPSGYF